MCGIIGVIQSPQASEEIFLGLQNLQHRGQDGGGIITSQAGQFFHHKGSGLLDIAFPEADFKTLVGSMGLGHTRYTTMGEKTHAMLQPFVSHKMGIALAHNGNLVNFPSLQKEFSSSDQAHPAVSGCDSEVLLSLLCQSLQTTLSQDQNPTPDDLHAAVKHLDQKVVGSYSVVGMHQTLGLFAFRDSLGLRPLVFGKRLSENGHMAYAFASESIALEFIGYDSIEAVQPGELIMISPEGTIERRSFSVEQPRQHCMFEWVYFARVESVVENLSVYRARFDLGIQLAEAVKQSGIEPDIVVAVPETSKIAAIALAEALKLPFREGLIKNRYVNRTFILESQEARQEAIRRKLYPIREAVEGKKVLLVDDSIVRGNTGLKIIQMLRKMGVKAIYLASTCPPIKWPCYYGVDFPSKEELLAGKYTEPELLQALGVDALVYQTMAGLYSALKSRALCTACLNGDYPTDIRDGKALEAMRVEQRLTETRL
jgi:amidophosphoribosyltransferase